MNIDGITAVDLLRAGLRAGARPRPVRPVALGRDPRPRLGAEAARPPDHGADAEGNPVSLQRTGAARRAAAHGERLNRTTRRGPSRGARTRTRRRHAMKDLIANQLVKYLEARGVKHIFGLCGHTNIAVLAALSKSKKIKFVNTRHEQIAAHAADGYARATKKTSVVLTHLSPGLTNAATGVANAALDSIPMVVIAGDVPTHYYGKHPHQEVNLHADASQYEIYRPFVKRAWRVDSAASLPRDHREGVHARRERAARAGAGRRADGHLLQGSRRRAVRARCGATRSRCTSPRSTTWRPKRSSARCSRRRRRCCTSAAASCSPTRPTRCANWPNTCRCRSRTR